MILLFKIRDASGERKYLITASNLTELTFSKDVFLKCSFNSFSPGVGFFFFTLLIDLSFPTLGNLIKIFSLKFVKSPPLACTPPRGVTLIGALNCRNITEWWKGGRDRGVIVRQRGDHKEIGVEQRYWRSNFGWILYNGIFLVTNFSSENESELIAEYRN